MIPFSKGKCKNSFGDLSSNNFLFRTVHAYQMCEPHSIMVHKRLRQKISDADSGEKQNTVARMPPPYSMTKLISQLGCRPLTFTMVPRDEAVESIGGRQRKKNTLTMHLTHRRPCGVRLDTHPGLMCVCIFCARFCPGEREPRAFSRSCSRPLWVNGVQWCSSSWSSLWREQSGGSGRSAEQLLFFSLPLFTRHRPGVGRWIHRQLSPTLPLHCKPWHTMWDEEWHRSG